MSKKILVVRYRFIGDTLLTVPFLRNLRAANPDAQIDMLVAPMSGEVIENCPYVDNFIYFDTTRKHKYENSKQEKKTFFSYVKQLRKDRYDKAYVLKRSISSAFLVFLSGIKDRVGFNTEGRGFLLTRRIPYDKNKHEIECFLDVLKADGVVVKDSYLENWIDEKVQSKIENIFAAKLVPDSKKVIVHATATNDGKIWPLENFAKLVEYLSNEKNVQVIYIGTDFDKPTYEKMQSLITSKLTINPVNFCGDFTLQESLAAIKLSDLLIGNDSGNLHMASSVGTKVVGLYGPMPFDKWFAYGDGNVLLRSNLPCMPCGLKQPCQINKRCLTDITVEKVINSLETLLP